MVVYEIQVQHTAGAYRGIKSYSSYEAAEVEMQKIIADDHIANSGNKHHTNRYRIVEKEIL